MQMTNQQTLPVPLLAAWEALNDLQLIQQAIPGCEGITTVDEGHHVHEVVVVAAVGPVKARFKGKLQLQDLVPPESYRLQFEGQGGAAGHGKGHAIVRLESAGEHETVLHYEAHATVGGKIAQLGSRLIDMAAQKMATEFFERFTAALVERHGPPPVAQGEAADADAEAAAPEKKGWFKRLLGKEKAGDAGPDGGAGGQGG